MSLTHEPILKYLNNEIHNNLDIIQLHSSRTRRSLMPSLGSAIKYITGNLDATDAVELHDIIDDIHKNEDRLQRQAELQYSFDKSTTDRFNNNLQTIQYNEENLKQKLNTITSEIDLLKIENTFDQILFLHENLLRISIQIQTNIFSCTTGTYHPSILTTSELQDILNLIYRLYPNQPVYQNLVELIPLLELRCAFKNNILYYSISFPLFKVNLFEYYYMLPIPFIHNDKTLTIVNENRFLLKNAEQILTVSNKHCFNQSPIRCLKTSYKRSTKCELQILQAQPLHSCDYAEVFEFEQLTFIPEMNSYVFFSHNNSKIRIQTSNEESIFTLSGTYIINASDVTIWFHNKTFRNTYISHAKPLYLSDPDLLPNLATLPRIELSNNKLETLSTHFLLQSQMKHNNIAIESFSWYLISWILLVCIMLSYATYKIVLNIQPCYRLLISKKSELVPTTNQEETVPMAAPTTWSLPNFLYPQVPSMNGGVISSLSTQSPISTDE